MADQQIRSAMLGRDRIQQLGRGGNAQAENLGEEPPGFLQARLDVAAAIEMRIHDEPLPADGGARLLKINPHDQENPIPHLLAQGRQALGIFPPSLHVVDRAGTHHEKESLVIALEDALDLLSHAEDHLGVCLRP